MNPFSQFINRFYKGEFRHWQVSHKKNCFSLHLFLILVPGYSLRRDFAPYRCKLSLVCRSTWNWSRYLHNWETSMPKKLWFTLFFFLFQFWNTLLVYKQRNLKILLPWRHRILELQWTLVLQIVRLHKDSQNIRKRRKRKKRNKQISYLSFCLMALSRILW